MIHGPVSDEARRRDHGNHPDDRHHQRHLKQRKTRSRPRDDGRPFISTLRPGGTRARTAFIIFSYASFDFLEAVVCAELECLVQVPLLHARKTRRRRRYGPAIRCAVNLASATVATMNRTVSSQEPRSRWRRASACTHRETPRPASMHRHFRQHTGRAGRSRQPRGARRAVPQTEIVVMILAGQLDIGELAPRLISLLQLSPPLSGSRITPRTPRRHALHDGCRPATGGRPPGQGNCRSIKMLRTTRVHGKHRSTRALRSGAGDGRAGTTRNARPMGAPLSRVHRRRRRCGVICLRTSSA